MDATVRARRLEALPPYLFAEIDRRRRAACQAGRDLIDLGVGDPDRPTPPFIVEALRQAARDAAHHRYPAGRGLVVFRQAAARFMHSRFGVRADPDRHILACLGSKDGIAHLPLAVVDPGQIVCVPVPGYPVYRAGAIFAGASIHEMPLLFERGFVPAMDRIPDAVARHARLLWVNYPNNPTGATVEAAFYERVLEFCAAHGIIAASDLAYSEIYFDEARRPPSLWQARNADLDATLAVEFHSLSKTFNMTGWRLGFAVGHPAIIAALATLKENVDSGVFNAVQVAGAVALEHFDHPDVEAIRAEYRRRRDRAVCGLRAIGCEVQSPAGGFFVWARCPAGADGRPGDSTMFVTRALEEAGVVLVPGVGFAESARHYVRVSLTVEESRLAQAMERLARVDWST